MLPLILDDSQRRNTVDYLQCLVKYMVILQFDVICINETIGIKHTTYHFVVPKVYGLWFNATFNNISVISWRSALLVEETGVPGENHRPVSSHWQVLYTQCCIEYALPWFVVAKQYTCWHIKLEKKPYKQISNLQ